MSELKPCPFCDGRVVVKTRYIGYGSLGLGSHDEYCIVCKECFASSDEYRSEAEAIAAWNRRADAMPMARGEWEEMRNPYGELEGWIHKKCGRTTKEASNFCPNCGAKMEARNEER